MTEQLHHAALSELITIEGWWFQASEIHGMLTAFIACNQREQIPRFLFPNTAPSPLAERMLERLASHIEEHLAATDLTFRLLLPEQTSLTARAEALIEWVEGFLMAKTFLQSNLALDREGKAFLHDLAEISKLDTQLSENEENSCLLNELEEHCRLGALMLYAHTHRPVVKKVNKTLSGEKK